MYTFSKEVKEYNSEEEYLQKIWTAYRNNYINLRRALGYEDGENK